MDTLNVIVVDYGKVEIVGLIATNNANLVMKKFILTIRNLLRLQRILKSIKENHILKNFVKSVRVLVMVAGLKNKTFLF